MTPLRSSLARYVARDPMSDDEIKAAARKAWHQQGTACIREEWVNDIDWLCICSIMDRVFGKRAAMLKRKGERE